MKKITVICLLIFLWSCGSSDDGKAVPLGEKSALESLAKSFNTLANDHRLSPSELSPVQKRKFVLDVFHKSGFSYSKTLQSVANSKDYDPQKKIHKDLVELLFYPHSVKWQVDKNDIYTSDELKWIQAIEKRNRG